MFDERLTFTNHVEIITASASKSLRFIIRTYKEFSNIDAIKSLVFALVVSKLEYAAVIWYPLYNLYVSSIEHIQRRF